MHYESKNTRPAKPIFITAPHPSRRAAFNCHATRRLTTPVLKARHAEMGLAHATHRKPGGSYRSLPQARAIKSPKFNAPSGHGQPNKRCWYYYASIILLLQRLAKSA